MSADPAIKDDGTTSVAPESLTALGWLKRIYNALTGGGASGLLGVVIKNSLGQENSDANPLIVRAYSSDGTATYLGAPDEGQPPTDTSAGYGLNGRLQRIAQNISAALAPLVAGTASATKAMLIAGKYLTTAPTLTDTQQGSILFDSRNNIKVTIVDGDGITTSKMEGSIGDASGNSISGMRVASYEKVYNGTVWDRKRSSATLTGVQQVALMADAAGGATPYTAASAANTTPVSIKATAGQLFGGYLYNAAATPRFVHVFNKTIGNVTPGTTVHDWVIPIPALGVIQFPFSAGLQFTTAISYYVSTGVGSTDNTAGSANDVVLALGYK